MENQWIKEGEIKPMTTMSIDEINPIEIEIDKFLYEDLLLDRDFLNKLIITQQNRYVDKEIKIIVRRSNMLPFSISDNWV